jgi:hypothetical protein
MMHNVFPYLSRYCLRVSVPSSSDDNFREMEHCLRVRGQKTVERNPLQISMKELFSLLRQFNEDNSVISSSCSLSSEFRA